MACGIFPDQGSNAPALAGRFFTTEPPGKPMANVNMSQFLKVHINQNYNVLSKEIERCVVKRNWVLDLWKKCPKVALATNLESLGTAIPNLLAPGTNFVEDNFSMHWGLGGWFGDDSRALHSLCILLLLFLHQLHLRSSGIRHLKLRTPALEHGQLDGRGLRAQQILVTV